MEPEQPEQPTPSIPATPETPAGARATGKRTLIVGLVATLIVVCVVCALGVALVTAASGGGGSASASGTTTITQATKATATIAHATATVTPPANDPTVVAAYANIVQIDGAVLRTDLNAEGADCSAAASDASQMGACRADLVTVQADASQFLSDLDATPAPQCLTSADLLLRKSLHLLISGSQDVINGIDNNDAAQVNTGVTVYKQATTYLDQSSQTVSQSHCA